MDRNQPGGGHTLTVADGRMALRLRRPLRGIASTIVGGGIGEVASWMNLQVPLDYGRTDPMRHLLEEAGDLPRPLAATMTAAEVGDWVAVRRGRVWAAATVGLSVPLAAAGHQIGEVDSAPNMSVLGSAARRPPKPGTINTAIICDAYLTDAGLVNAVQTAAEAKAQALADSAVAAANHDGPATGTATDSILVLTAGAGVPTSFAGPASPVGHDIATAVHEAMLAGIIRWRGRER